VPADTESQTKPITLVITLVVSTTGDHTHTSRVWSGQLDVGSYLVQFRDRGRASEKRSSDVVEVSKLFEMHKGCLSKRWCLLVYACLGLSFF
jgi:hypothetical protein